MDKTAQKRHKCNSEVSNKINSGKGLKEEISLQSACILGDLAVIITRLRRMLRRKKE